MSSYTHNTKVYGRKDKKFVFFSKQTSLPVHKTKNSVRIPISLLVNSRIFILTNRLLRSTHTFTRTLTHTQAQIRRERQIRQRSRTVTLYIPPKYIIACELHYIYIRIHVLRTHIEAPAIFSSHHIHLFPARSLPHWYNPWVSVLAARYFIRPPSASAPTTVTRREGW